MAQYPRPLTVVYHPSKSHWLVCETFHSREAIRQLPKPDDTTTVTLRALSPNFYTSIMQYEDASVAIGTELNQSPLPADRQSQRLWACDPAQLREIFVFTKLDCTAAANAALDWRTRARQALIRWLRKTSKPTFMDTFAYGHLQPCQQTEYQVALFRHLLAEQFALGSHELLRLYEHMALIAVAWMLLALANRAIGGMLLEEIQIAVSVGVIFFAGWIHLWNSL